MQTDTDNLSATGGCVLTFIWLGFGTLFLFLVFLDLGVFSKKVEDINAREALIRTAVWVGLALAFVPVVYYLYENHVGGLGHATAQHDAVTGKAAALSYLTGWIVEYALSVDNLFVIALIFSALKIEGNLRHRVLFWGVLGAAIMRAVLILFGFALWNYFEWITYVFGAILILSALKMLKAGDADSIDTNNNLAIRLTRKVFPVSPTSDGPNFITRMDGKRALTPLALALIMVEVADLTFAVDSIPAVIAITHEPFLAYTSNLFAILGLRSLFFALDAVMKRFTLVKYSLILILIFIGAKMILEKWVHISVGISLGVVVSLLAIGVIASLIKTREKPAI